MLTQRCLRLLRGLRLRGQRSPSVQSRCVYDPVKQKEREKKNKELMELKRKVAEEELEVTRKQIDVVQRQIEQLRKDVQTWTKLDENDYKLDNMRADMMTYREELNFRFAMLKDEIHQ